MVHGAILEELIGVLIARLIVPNSGFSEGTAVEIVSGCPSGVRA